MAVIDRPEIKGRPINRSGFPEGNNPGLVSPYGEPLFRGGIITPFGGKTREYFIERYWVTDGNRRELTVIATDIYLQTYPERDREQSTERMKHNLSYPRTVMHLARYGGVPIGGGVLRKMTVVAGFPGRRERVAYSSRFIIEEHEREGIGTLFLEEGIKAQDEEGPLDAVALMTQNVLSPVTLRKSLQRLNFGRTIHPFDETYINPDHPDTNRPERDLLVALYKEVGSKTSRGLTIESGLSEAELGQIGMNERYYRPPRSFTEAWGYYQQMLKWGFNRERGDVIYVVAPRKKPVNLAGVTVGK